MNLPNDTFLSPLEFDSLFPRLLLDLVLLLPPCFVYIWVLGEVFETGSAADEVGLSILPVSEQGEFGENVPYCIEIFRG